VEQSVGHVRLAEQVSVRFGELLLHRVCERTKLTVQKVGERGRIGGARRDAIGRDELECRRRRPAGGAITRRRNVAERDSDGADQGVPFAGRVAAVVRLQHHRTLAMRSATVSAVLALAVNVRLVTAEQQTRVGGGQSGQHLGDETGAFLDHARRRSLRCHVCDHHAAQTSQLEAPAHGGPGHTHNSS
jgi:hypothetical protein